MRLCLYLTRLHEQARVAERADHAVRQARKMDLPEPQISAVIHNAQRRQSEADRALADAVREYLVTL